MNIYALNWTLVMLFPMPIRSITYTDSDRHNAHGEPQFYSNARFHPRLWLNVWGPANEFKGGEPKRFVSAALNAYNPVTFTALPAIRLHNFK